jgi:hypothetical protein
MKNIDVNEIYTLFEEIRELVKAGNTNNTASQPEIELPDLSAINELSYKLDETIKEIRKPVKTEYHHIFSIASGKVFFGVIAISIVLLISLFVIYHQRKEIITYRDNDLKYRYIRVQGKVISEDFSIFDSLFYFNRDGKKIKELRKYVEAFEENVKQRARIIEQEERLKAEKERLEKESNTSRKSK